MTEKSQGKRQSASERWLSYRADLKVLDCTIRDGGLMSNHRIDESVVQSVYRTCCDAGIDYMEIGYKSSKRIYSPDEYGPWKFCDEEALRRIVGDEKGDVKLSVMADAERCDYREDIVARGESVLDMIRVACYIHQLPVALDMIKDAHDKGYETTLNLMAVSTVPEWELDEALGALAESEVDVLYVVDSFGSLYSEQVHYLVDRFSRYAHAAGKQVGMHAHNNQQLAFANTIEAIIKGVNVVDASMAGMGRGAGNCLMELLIGFLHNPRYRLRPVLQCIQSQIEPLREALRWGFEVPYGITGLLNRHPRTAMCFNAGEERMDIVKFYDQITEEE